MRAFFALLICIFIRAVFLEASRTHLIFLIPFVVDSCLFSYKNAVSEQKCLGFRGKTYCFKPISAIILVLLSLTPKPSRNIKRWFSTLYKDSVLRPLQLLQLFLSTIMRKMTDLDHYYNINNVYI